MDKRMNGKAPGEIDARGWFVFRWSFRCRAPSSPNHFLTLRLGGLALFDSENAPHQGQFLYSGVKT